MSIKIGIGITNFCIISGGIYPIHTIITGSGPGYGGISSFRINTMLVIDMSIISTHIDLRTIGIDTRFIIVVSSIVT